jgi:hypothetical protein
MKKIRKSREVREECSQVIAFIFSSNDMEGAMKFEFLANEIIIVCFEYLNAPYLFDAFDKLNYRFQTLIRNIPLRLNFQHVKKTTFDQFCQRMLFNPEMKSQIYSLQLSNVLDTCGQIKVFLSLFSFDEFCHLQSLTLMNVKKDEIDKHIATALPSLSKLHYFCFHPFVHHGEVLSAVPS